MHGIMRIEILPFQGEDHPDSQLDIQISWDNLTETELETLINTRPVYLKKLFCVSIFALST